MRFLLHAYILCSLVLFSFIFNCATSIKFFSELSKASKIFEETVEKEETAVSIGDFFFPDIGTGLTYAVYLGINVAAIIFGISFPAWLFAYLRKLKRRNKRWSKKEFFTALAISAGSTIFLMWLCYCAVNSLHGSIYDLAQRLIQVFDPVLGVRQLISNPINGFFGINLSLRMAAVCLSGMAILTAWKGSGQSAEQFARYLDRTFLSKKDGTAPPEKDGGSPQDDGASSRDEEHGKKPPEKSGSLSQGDGTSHWDALLSRFATLLASGSGLGLLAYILGPAEMQESIKDILETASGFLDKVTLMSQVDPGATGLIAFFTNSLFVVLSIFMLGVYVAVILLLAAFIQAIIKNRAKIIAWIEKKGKILWACLGVVLLAAGVCAAIVAVSYGVTNSGSFIGAFQGRTLGIFVSNFVVLSLSVCAGLLVLLFVLSFAILASAYAVHLIRRLIWQWFQLNWAKPAGPYNAGRAAGMLLGAFVWTALLIATGWGYPQIQAWLEDLFSNKNPLQMLGRLALLALMLEGALAITAAGLLLALLMLKGAVALLGNKGAPIVDQVTLLVKSILLRTVEFFSLLPFFVAHACSALRSVLYTILQIFIGYRNESEKNSALFTAACFASLASLLNTFFGLKGFYNASGHLELILCSAAIACAVQLAMLIFGMKAGEGFAEKKFMLGSRKEKGKSKAGSAQKKTGECLIHPRRLPPYRYLVAYLLLMVISTGFAFNNMFGYYASTSHVHERVYDQVHYKTDEELQLSLKIGTLISEYNTNTGEILKLFSQRAEETSKVRMEIETHYRNTADSSNKVPDANARDRFIGKSRDLEALIAAIKSFVEADDATIGKNVQIDVENYDHYWGGNSQPSYRTACLIIYYNGDMSDKQNAIFVGSYLDQDSAKVKELPYTDAKGNKLTAEFDDIPRYFDPDSKVQSIIKSTRKVVGADKYSILRELIGQYEQLESRIYDDPNFYHLTGRYRRPEQSLGVLLNDRLTRNTELDGIRANIVDLCHSVNNETGDLSDGQSASIQNLRQTANEYLNPNTLQQIEGDPIVRSYDELSAYIDRSLALYNILAGYTDKTNTYTESPQNSESLTVPAEPLKVNETNPSDDSAALAVRKFQNYAQGLTYSNFQISYDALLRGVFNLNPVKDHVNTLYSSTIVARFILFICFIVDMMAFFAGLLLFKDIYLFSKNSMITDIGYLNYETALNSLFAIPKGSRERVLFLTAVYKLLYGDATEDGAPPVNSGDNVQENDSCETPEADASKDPEEDIGTVGGTGTTEEDNCTAEKNSEHPGEGSGITEESGRFPEEEAGGEKAPQDPADDSKETDSLVVPEKRLHEILLSEDFKKFYRKVEATLKALGISEDEANNYHMFLLWLRNYIERNNLDFNDVFYDDK